MGHMGIQFRDVFFPEKTITNMISGFGTKNCWEEKHWKLWKTHKLVRQS